MRHKKHLLMDEPKEGEGNSGITPERFENFQKEMDRKLSNSQCQIEKLVNSNQELMQYINSSQKQSQQNSPDSDSISDLLYTNPDQAIEIIEKRASDKIEKKLSAQNDVAAKQQAKVNNVLSKLAGDYPELSQPSSQLSQKAVEIFNDMAEEDRSNQAVAYKAAIMEAVSELGIKKAKDRKVDDGDVDYGDFVLGGNKTSRKSRDRKPKLDASTVEFAAAMGLDIEDKEVLKRLAKRGQRDFSRYGN